MADITVRMAGWSSILQQTSLPTVHRQSGCIDDELWNSRRGRGAPPGLAAQIARGYQDNAYRPFDPVLNVQAVAFITRTMVAMVYGSSSRINATIYPNITDWIRVTGSHLTYYFSAARSRAPDPCATRGRSGTSPPLAPTSPVSTGRLRSW